MSKLFNDIECDDNEEQLKINSEYANNYNNWRQKEELNKLKTKYGDHLKELNSSDDTSESSEDDEDGNQLTEEFERDFFKTLSCLKKKDPKIYNNEVIFFPSTQSDDKSTNAIKSSKNDTKLNKKKDKPLFLRDYERKLIIERDGILSESDDETEFIKKSDEKIKKPQTYVEEQRELQASIKQALKDNDDDDDGGLLKIKTKSEEEKIKEEENYKQWLSGETEKINDGDKKELECLRDFWSDPNLNKNEKFLRDYVLNKKFLDNENNDNDNDYHYRLHDSDNNLSDDEENILKQEEFEHKYNFRFEEPDIDFIKRYPRTMENSLRKKDNRRALKRIEIKKRKEQEKLKQKEELKQLKALKRKEIMDKISQLKEITGNDDINLDAIDLDADFDPNEHDKKMQQIFNEDYYNVNHDQVKPEFPELDEELEIEKDWDNVDPNILKNDPNYDPNHDPNHDPNYDPNYGPNHDPNYDPKHDPNHDPNYDPKHDPNHDLEFEPHCEDAEFNMDADYDPNNEQRLENEIIGPSKRKRRRKSKFAKLIATEKPKFNPILHSSFRDYFDQYYALDYEDMIGDIPCRFKYRKVVPNDYGLTTEEILLADDKELNKWCSLKKALEHKAENVELKEVQIYKQKAKNEAYKKKILTSLYKSNENDDNDDDNKNEGDDKKKEETGKKKRKNKKNKKNQSLQNPKQEDLSELEMKNDEVDKKKVINEKMEVKDEDQNGEFKTALNKNKIDMMISKQEVRVEKLAINGKKKKNKQKTTNNEIHQNNGKLNPFPIKKSMKTKNFKSKKIKEKLKSVKNLKLDHKNDDVITSISDKRLEAYGINPKKFKNKLKYGKNK